MKVKTVKELPPPASKHTKYSDHYAAALAGKIVELPTLYPSVPTIKSLGLCIAVRDGKRYIFKPKAQHRNSK